MSCGPDCWLKEEKLTSLESSVDDYNAVAQHTGSQPVLQPHEAASHIYKSIYPWQTRLIRLEPGSLQDPLRCELLTADIVSSKGFGEGLGVHEYGAFVEYTALSYFWGDNHIFTHPLHCGDILVGLSANLASALYHF